MLWATSKSTYKIKSPLLPFLSLSSKTQQQKPISFLTTVINTSNTWTDTEFCPLNVLMGFVMVFRINTNYFPNSYVNKCPTRCNYTQFILSVNFSTYFGWLLHPSSGFSTLP